MEFGRHSVVLIFALTVSGCQAIEQVAYLSPDGFESLIIIQGSTDAFLIQARDLRGSGDIVLEQRLRPENIGTYVVYGYESSLDVLGVPSGALTATAEGSPLPTPDAVFRLRDDDGEPGFESLESPPAELSLLRVAETDPCRQYIEEYRELDAEPNERAMFLHTLDSDRLLLGLSSGNLRVVTLEGETAVEPLSEPGRPSSAVTGPDGEIWIAHLGGAVSTGHPDSGFAAGPTIPVPKGEEVKDLAASRGDAPFELYATTSSSSVFRLADPDGSWELVREGNEPTLERSRARIEWLGPGHVAVIGLEELSILEVQADGTETNFALPVPSRPTREAFHELQFVDGVGVVAGTRYSSFFVRREESWVRMPLPSITPIVIVVIDLGDGSFFAGGESWVLAKWLPERGQCPPIPLEVPGDSPPADGARLGDGAALISSGYARNEPIRLVTLRPRHR